MDSHLVLARFEIAVPSGGQYTEQCTDLYIEIQGVINSYSNSMKMFRAK